MKNFSELSVGILIFLVVVLLVEIYLAYSLEDDIDVIDYDNNNIITTEEFERYMRYKNKKEKTQISTVGILKSIFLGGLRGGITGALINGFEGAYTGAIVMGIINPIIIGAEALV